MAQLDDDGGPSVVGKTKKKKQPVKSSFVPASIRNIESKSNNDLNDILLKKKVAKRRPSGVIIPKLNQDSGSTLKSSQSSDSTNDNEISKAVTDNILRSKVPFKKHPPLKTRPSNTNDSSAATIPALASPVKKVPPKKHPPKNVLSPTAPPASKRTLMMSPSTPAGRGIQRRASTSDIVGRQSPANASTSTDSSSSTKPTTAAKHAVSKSGKGRPEPATRGMKRYSSMPAASTMSKEKPAASRNTADDARSDRGQRSIPALGSIEESSPVKKTSSKKKKKKINGSSKKNKGSNIQSPDKSPSSSLSSRNDRTANPHLFASIRKLPLLNPTMGDEDDTSERSASNRGTHNRSGNGRTGGNRSGRRSPKPDDSDGGLRRSPRAGNGSTPSKNTKLPQSPSSSTLAKSTRRLSSSLVESIRNIPFWNPTAPTSSNTSSERNSGPVSDSKSNAKESTTKNNSENLSKKAEANTKQRQNNSVDTGATEDPTTDTKKSMSKAKSPKPAKRLAASLPKESPVKRRPTLSRAQSERNVPKPTKQQQQQQQQVPTSNRNLDVADDPFAVSNKEPPPRVPRRGSRKELLRASSMMNLTSPSNAKKTNDTAANVALRRPVSSSQMRNGGNPLRRSPSGRRLPPGRTQSSDLECMHPFQATAAIEEEESSSATRQTPSRSRSGDLELWPTSSMHERTGIEAPPSILRNSSHNYRQSILRNSTHHHATSTVPRRDPTARARFPETLPLSSDDGDDVDGDDNDDDYSIEEISLKFDDSPPKPRSARPGLGPRRNGRPELKKTRSLADLSSHHSLRSTRSVMSVDKEEKFPDDPSWKRCLRYIRILPPHPDEKPDRKWVRIYVWFTLMLDFIAAMVSITTYGGVTTCCGVPIFSLSFVDVDWNKAIRITTYVYLVMIFAEIMPVVRRGLPFNLLNPMIGFTITFAMFFDDRILEAVSMWIIEATAIVCEFLTYRLQRKIYHERYDRLDEVERDLTSYTSSRTVNASRRNKFISAHSKRGGLSSSHSKRMTLSSSSRGSNGSDDDSLSGHSFGDEESGDVEEQLNGSSELPKSSNHKLREARLLRERRILRQRQAADRLQLRYHLGGVVINFGLICISLILIVVIASSGGLCIRNDSRPVVFDMNQLDKCSDCRGRVKDGVCEICEPDGQMQCYYQYI